MQSSGNQQLLARLTDYLSDDLEQVHRLIQSILQSQIGLTNQVSSYIQAASGKRLRPMLALLASRLGGERVERAVPAAAMAELLHVASLLHDDVIDRAQTRRGRPTINARWGNDVAILMADYLYSRAFATALEHLTPDLIAVFIRATSAMCDGEIFQIEKRDQLLTEQDYLYIIECKTARLFAVSARVGATLAGLPPQAADALERYGLDFGRAFQITDDVLDLTADPAQFGKDIATDIASGKQTLPLIHAIRTAEPGDRDFLIQALSNGSAEAAASAQAAAPSEVIARVVRYGGIDYAVELARACAARARESLNPLPPSPAADFLRDLTDLVVHRTY
jgi:octaprenyl-diphosphate synthase